MSHVTEARAGTLQRRLGRAFLALWIPLVALGVSSLMVGHFAPLPAPAAEAATVEAALGAARSRGAEVAVVHFLDVECRCSKRVAEHLLEGPRPAGAHEAVVLVGADAELQRALTARGFAVEPENKQSAERRFGSFAAPALAVLGTTDGDVRYLGGYTDRKQGLHVRDLEIIDACARGESPAVLPVLGCGATADLERMLDPLRLQS